MVGMGAVSGASLGGAIAESIGWRWCFLLQMPASLVALVVGYNFLKDPIKDTFGFDEENNIRSIFARVDITGSVVLVVTLLVQLFGLSLGGNELPWSSPWIIGALAGSVPLLVCFAVVEARTSAAPIIPMRMLTGIQPTFAQITNVFSGMASYAVSPRLIAVVPLLRCASFYSCCHYSFKLCCWIHRQRPEHV
jgi:MFS family permease